jgi:hypothetical protein
MTKFLLFPILLLSLPAHANEEAEEDRKIVYKQKTEIDFEGVEVEGQLVKPQGSLILNRRAAHFNPLIKLRTDFDDMMDDSVKEVK